MALRASVRLPAVLRESMAVRRAFGVASRTDFISYQSWSQKPIRHCRYEVAPSAGTAGTDWDGGVFDQIWDVRAAVGMGQIRSHVAFVQRATALSWVQAPTVLGRAATVHRESLTSCQFVL